MATASKSKTTFGVNCVHCRDEDATVTLDLNNLNECRCSGCDQTYSPRQARDLAAEQLKRWEAVVRFVEMAGQAMAE